MADVDLFTVAGQSNAVGFASGGPSVSAGEFLEFDHKNEVINDPIGDPIQMAYSEEDSGSSADQSSSGSAWPSFANEYYSQRGVTGAIVGTANGGSGVTDGASGLITWNATSGGSYSLLDQAVHATNEAITALENAGHTVNYRGILWHQGERDAQNIDDGSITKSDYDTAFRNMIAEFRSQLGPGTPFWIFELGHPNSGDTSGFQDIRDVQNSVVGDQSNTYMVSTIQKDFPEEGKMSDDLHYNQTGYNEMGTTGAGNVAANISAPSAGGSGVVAVTTAGVIDTELGVISTGVDTTAPTISNFNVGFADKTAPTISNFSVSEASS